MSWWIVLSINCEKIVSLCHQNPPKCICFHYISDKQQIPKTEKMEQPRLFLFCFVFQHFSFKNSWIQFQLTSRSINLLIILALVLTQISFGLLWNPAVDCNQHINYANIFWADFRKMYRCFFFFLSNVSKIVRIAARGKSRFPFDVSCWDPTTQYFAMTRLRNIANNVWPPAFAMSGRERSVLPWPDVTEHKEIFQTGWDRAKN